MTLRALVISDADRKDISVLVSYASEREHWFDAFDRSDGWLDRLPGHNPKLIHKLFDGYRCVFSYTLDTKNNVVWRQLSVSVSGKDRYPSPEAIQTIAPLFGFTGEMEPPPRMFPLEWQVHVKRDEQLDDHCVVIIQDAGIRP